MTVARPTSDEAAIRDQADAAAFRPNARPMLIAVGLNVLLAASFLGIPYYRGKVATREALIAFGNTAGCILDAKPTRSLGLSLPAGERDHFADQVLHADGNWPTRCLKTLATVPPEQATFLWPSVKTAIGDVHATAKLVDRELTELHKARVAGITRVPERPLLALARMRAALTLLARAANVSDTIDEPAIAFDKALMGAEPSRLPLNAGPTATTQVWLEGGGVQALALDARGLSWVSVAAGEIDRFRVKRSSLLRGTLVERAGPRARAGRDSAFAAFAMPQARCADLPDHCVRRAIGIADLALGSEATSNAIAAPEPHWLAAHPRARFDRSVLVTGDSIDVLALASAEGALELRRFPRSALSAHAEKAVPQDGAELKDALANAGISNEPARKPPLPPTERWPIEGTTQGFDALLLPGESTRVVVARRDAQTIRVSLIEPTLPDAAPLSLGEVGGNEPWIAACAAAAPSVIAFGSEDALALVRVSRDAQGGPLATSLVAPLATAALALGAPLTAENPHADRVRMQCGQTLNALFALSTESELLALVCDGDRCDQSTVARNVASFDAAIVAGEDGREQVVLAYSGVRDPSILVTRLQHAAGQALAPTATRVVAGCWDPAAGLCGAPTLAALGTRVLLASRDGSDLRALESHDIGESWHPLASLSTGPALERDPARVMDQHRLRKGLDK